MPTKYEELVQEVTEPDEPTPEDEPEPQPEPAPDEEEEEEEEEPASEPQAFDVKLFEREQKRHEKELGRAFGESFADMTACDTCGGVGFTPSDFTPPPEVKPDPTLVRCADCNGWGDRETPSLKEGYLFVPCTTCNGTGYRDKDALEAQRLADSYRAPEAYAPPPPQPTWNPVTQQWEAPGPNGPIPVYVAPVPTPSAT